MFPAISLIVTVVVAIPLYCFWFFLRVGYVVVLEMVVELVSSSPVICIALVVVLNVMNASGGVWSGGIGVTTAFSFASSERSVTPSPF